LIGEQASSLQRAPYFPLFYKGLRFLIRWKSDETEPPDRDAWVSSMARARHDDRCFRQLFIPCQVTEEIADKLAEEAADNAHCVAPSDINTWNLTGGKGDSPASTLAPKGSTGVLDPHSKQG